MIYFWSDTHFNHSNIIDYCSRPYKDVEEMNKDLIERWNSVVKSGEDEIYLLGDFAYGGLDKIAPIFRALKGKKHLIIGNHDEKNSSVIKHLWWSSAPSHLRVVKYTRPLTGEKVKVVLCHYPIESWPSAHHGALHLHGHCHGRLKRKVPHRWDAGVDVEPFPRSIEHYIQEAEKQEFSPEFEKEDL